MQLVRFDISQVEGWPFEAGDEALREYGCSGGHPILERYFDASAPVRFYYWKKLGLLCRLVGEGREGVALAAGCGPGVELPTLATGFRHVIALDINGDDLDIARRISRRQQLYNVEIMNADLLDPPLEPGSIDTIFLIDVLEHFPDAGAAIESVHRLLKDEGRLVVAVPTENRFNDSLRRAMGYSKPESHYHGSRELEAELKKRFTLLKKKRPFGLPYAASLSEIFLLSK